MLVSMTAKESGEPEAEPGVKKRRQRLDGDRDREVRGTPDDVDDAEGEPDVETGGTPQRGHVGKT